MPGLFDPLRVGAITLPNRILMAPMTRGRAQADGTPTPPMVEYYARRAEAGLLITEATATSPAGRGWCNAPSLYATPHVAAWRAVTAAVHGRGGRIFAQLWFVGRVSHPDFLEGDTPLAPSAIRPEQAAHTPTGTKPCVTPREMTLDDIRSAVDDYASGARNAIAAGFDGVEVHAANGYLPDQFLRDGSNRRQDAYGGSIAHRVRFLAEVVEAIGGAIGRERVGVRLSPYNAYNDMRDSDPVATFESAARMLSGARIAFLEIMEGLPGHFLHVPGEPILPRVRAAYEGVLVANGGYDGVTAARAIAAGAVDAVAFGIPFLSNPDFVERLRIGAPLNAPDPATFYSAGEPGYLDYPTLAEAGGRAVGDYRELSLDEAKRH